MTLTRRQVFATTSILAGAGVAGALLGASSVAQAAAEIDQADLAKAGPDGDIVLGSEKAPVTVIEYASMTCPHCAHFATATFAELQKRYIDNGKVRFIFREFPFDALAAADHARALCRQGQIPPGGGDAIREAVGMDGAEARTGAHGYRQTVRVYPGVIR